MPHMFEEMVRAPRREEAEDVRNCRMRVESRTKCPASLQTVLNLALRGKARDFIFAKDV